MVTSTKKIVSLLFKLLLFCFVLVSPFANEVNPAIIAISILLLLLAFPAMLVVFRAKRPMFEVLAFLPMLGVSIAVGLNDGNIPANVLRGSIPYVIYIIAFAAVLYLPPEKRLNLARWYVIVAAMVSFKTFAILALNGVSPLEVLRGFRATFLDINSGLSISMAAVPFVFVCFKGNWTRALLLFLLVGQVILGQSKSLMVLTALFLAVFFVVYIPKPKFITVRALIMMSKVFAFVGVVVVVILTFNQNPLLQRFSLMITDPKTELSGRIYEVTNVLEVVEDRPLLGRGQGYVFVHKAADSPDDAPVYEERRYTHSVLFYHIAIMGYLGMPFAMLMLHGPAIYIFFAWVLRRAKRRHVASAIPGMAERFFLPVMMSSFGLLAFNLVSASFKNPQSLILLGFVNAMAFTLLASRKSSAATRPATVGRVSAV